VAAELLLSLPLVVAASLSSPEREPSASEDHQFCKRQPRICLVCKPLAKAQAADPAGAATLKQVPMPVYPPACFYCHHKGHP